MDYLNPWADDHGREKMNEEASASHLTPARCFLPGARTSEVQTAQILRGNTGLMWNCAIWNENLWHSWGVILPVAIFSGSHFVFGHRGFFFPPRKRLVCFDLDPSLRNNEDLCERLSQITLSEVKQLHVISLWGQMKYALPKSPHETNPSPLLL